MIDIVIVNWNSGEYLWKSINSIFLTNNEKFVNKVFVIDNNSTDSSLNRIVLNDKITIIKNKENNGFAKASNQGFKLCVAPFILLLNPDARLLDSTLEDCISFMEKELGVDILGCRLLDDDGEISPSCARFPTAAKMFMDSIGLSKLFPSIFTPAILMSDWDHKTSRYVDQVMGAFMFMRRSVFNKVGYFDEQFFVYSEELDFSKRLSDIGGKSYFNTNITAMHSGGGTTNEVKGFRLSLNLRSRLLYAKKHFNYGGYLLVWLGTFFIEPFSRIFFLLFSGRFKEIKALFEGYKMLIRNSQITNP